MREWRSFRVDISDPLTKPLRLMDARVCVHVLGLKCGTSEHEASRGDTFPCDEDDDDGHDCI
jgi:hypothetical protein